MESDIRPAKWRYLQSAGYGVIFGTTVAACTIATTRSPLTPGDWFAIAWYNIASGVIMFLVVAAIRNAIMRAR